MDITKTQKDFLYFMFLMSFKTMETLILLMLLALAALVPTHACNYCSEPPYLRPSPPISTRPPYVKSPPFTSPPVIAPPVVDPSPVYTYPPYTGGTPPSVGLAPPSGGSAGLPGINPPPSSTGKCSIDLLKLGLCVDVLGGLVHIGLGDPVENACCPLLEGLVDLEASICLCTAIRIKVLNINIYIPLALQVLITCGKDPPPGNLCPAL